MLIDGTDFTWKLDPVFSFVSRTSLVPVGRTKRFSRKPGVSVTSVVQLLFRENRAAGRVRYEGDLRNEVLYALVLTTIGRSITQIKVFLHVRLHSRTSVLLTVHNNACLSHYTTITLLFPLSHLATILPFYIMTSVTFNSTYSP
jgi:hypothetical protein